MANVEQETRKKKAPTGSSSRFALFAAAGAIIALALAWIVSTFTDPDPMALGRGVATDANPVIVTDPATGTEAPLTSDAQGATREELNTTPPNTTSD